MPKKQIRNAFYFFMCDWKKEQEKKGRQFNSFKDVQADPACTQAWTSMTKAQKGPYESMAKESKNQIRNLGKQTGTGESVDFLEREFETKQKFQDDMQNYIKCTVEMEKDTNAIKSREFYFIHVNYFYMREKENNEVDYAPAEFAVVRFSLAKGVQEIYHQLIYCKPPLGFTREAMETSKVSHQIPCELSMGEKDFSVMYEKLIEFIEFSKKPGEDMPPLYTNSKCTDIVKSLLKYMSKATGLCLDDIMVYSLECLFSSLRNACQKNGMNVPTVLADYEMTKDIFSFTPGLECEFHRSLDGCSQYCSMSIVKRWVFTICDYCCENWDIEMKPGAHCPLNINEHLNGTASLNESMSSLSIRSTRSAASTLFKAPLSMTGVSDEHREKASARTAEEEKRRRNESKPIQIIDHSKPPEISPKTEVQVGPLPTRNLRIPRTYAMIGVDSAPDLDSEVNFPAIGGRGLALKKKKNFNSQPQFGRGHGSPKA